MDFTEIILNSKVYVKNTLHFICIKSKLCFTFV